MGDEIYNTLIDALSHYENASLGYDEDIDAAYAWIAAQRGETWVPVSGLQMTAPDSRLKLILHGQELILVNPFRPETRFKLPDGMYVCRKGE